ncbi:Imm32 family immunity protein [Chamaesiphon minutus]|nr:hypothetical protein [Chamaesiphon minutus]
MSEAVGEVAISDIAMIPRIENERDRLSIAIVYSESDYGNADISGTPESLRQVCQFMIDFVESDRVEATIATLNVDPVPYDRCLQFLSIRREVGAVKVSAIDDKLEIVGNGDRLTTFADWFNFPDDTANGYHCHHEPWDGNEEWVHPQSLPLVIGVGSR